MERNDRNYKIAVILMNVIIIITGILATIYQESKILILGFLFYTFVVVLYKIVIFEDHGTNNNMTGYLLAATVWFLVVYSIVSLITFLILFMFFQRESVSTIRLREPQVVENKVCGLDNENTIICIPVSTADAYYISSNKPNVVNIKVSSHLIGENIELYKDYNVLNKIPIKE